MADLTITASQVTSTATSELVARGVAGESIAAGNGVYLKTTDGKYYLAKSATAAEANLAGLAMNSAAASQPIQVSKGLIQVSTGTLTGIGTVYVVSATAGMIAPVSDLASSNFVTVAGVGGATVGQMLIHPVVSGYQKP